MSAKQTMSDREFMEDMLLTAKALSNIYHNAVQESSTQQLHIQFQDYLNDTLSMQHDIFSLMQQQGWYPQQQVESNQINQVKNKFSG